MASVDPRRLLLQARHLATKERLRPQQASLRRAVSSAYYALFHLLVTDASKLLAGNDKRLAKLIARSFVHGEMNAACEVFTPRGNPPVVRPPAIVDAIFGALTVPAELTRVAQAFRDLQTSRHDADYSTHLTWTRTEALSEVERAEDAFRDWEIIRPRSRAARRGAAGGGPAVVPPIAPAVVPPVVPAVVPIAPVAVVPPVARAVAPGVVAAVGAAAVPVPPAARVLNVAEQESVRLFLTWLTLGKKVQGR